MKSFLLCLPSAYDFSRIELTRHNKKPAQQSTKQG
jgi:hypothetical protein